MSGTYCTLDISTLLYSLLDIQSHVQSHVGAGVKETQLHLNPKGLGGEGKAVAALKRSQFFSLDLADTIFQMVKCAQTGSAPTSELCTQRGDVDHVLQLLSVQGLSRIWGGAPVLLAWKKLKFWTLFPSSVLVPSGLSLLELGLFTVQALY